MSVKIFYIPFHYRGATEFLLNTAVGKIRGPDYSKVLYIAPTPRKVRDAQQIFHKIKGGCYISPEILTIKQLSKKLYSLYGEKHIIPGQLIPVILARISGRGIGYASIIADFISEIKQYHSGKSIDIVEGELMSIFSDLGIPEEVSSRAKDALGIFKTYQEVLEKEAVLDEDDVMTLCPHLIRKHSQTTDCLILDGFYELTKSEDAIVKVLIENAGDTIVSIPYDVNLTDITRRYVDLINFYFKAEEALLSVDEAVTEPYYQPCSSIEEEVEVISRNIKNHFISGKITNLEKAIIAFPKLSEYSDITERVFRRYGIPCEIFNPMPVGKTRPFLDFIACLESVADDYPRLPFSRFLISPYFKHIPQVLRERIPMLCLTSGVMKGKDAWLTVIGQSTPHGQSAARCFQNEIEKGLKWVFRKLSPLESIGDHGTFSQYSEVISKLLNDLNFSDPVEQKEDLEELVSKACRTLSFLDLLMPQYTIEHNNKVSPSLPQYIDALRYILNTTDREKEGHGVKVMSLFEMRGIEPEYLYLGGLKEGDLPSKPDMDYLLPDSVRTRFGLINLKRYLLLQKFLFLRTMESAQNIYLSYPLMEGDRFFLPSPLLPWNKEKQGRVSGILSREEELLRKGAKPFSSYITQIEKVDGKYIRNKFGESSCINVTDIDYYRSCPRKFFIERVLHLDPPEIKEYKIEAMLLGSIVHEIMQDLLTKSFTDFEDLRSKAEQIMIPILSKKPIEQYWKNMIMDSFIAILPEIYELEGNINDDGYSFMRAEVSVEGELLKGIKLKGKIDRIDKKVQSLKFKVQNLEDRRLTTHHPAPVSNIVQLIDYKTGMMHLSGTQVMSKGANLQLFLYAGLMKTLGYEVERADIYSLKDMHLSWIPGKLDRKHGRTMKDYINISLRYLEETVSGMRKGDFSALPLEEQTCRNCSERPYCPYIQGKG